MSQSRNPKVYVIGTGPGSRAWLTPAAKKALREADIVIGWQWSLRTVKHIITNQNVYIEKDAKSSQRIQYSVANLASKSGQTVAILRVGDPCVSSRLALILEIFCDFDIEIIPCVGSVQLMAAAAKVCLDESVIVSFHDGRKNPTVREAKLVFLLDAFKRGNHLIVLTDESQMPCQTASYLICRGIDEMTPVVVGENLTLKYENMFRLTLGETADREFDLTSVMVVKNI